MDRTIEKKFDGKALQFFRNLSIECADEQGRPSLRALEMVGQDSSLEKDALLQTGNFRGIGKLAL